MAEADHASHPIGWSVYDVAARSSVTVAEETRLVRKVEKQVVSLAEDEIKFPLTLCGGGSADAVGPI